MESERYARAAARLLASPAPEAARAGAEDRDRMVEALAAALRLRARRGRGRRRTIIGALAAGVLIAAGATAVLLAERSRAITAHIDGGPRLAAGSVIRADRPLDVSLSTGTRLRLTDGGWLEVAELSPRQRFVLQRGRVLATVARLAPGQRFVVSTADAEIEVRGTAFEVKVVPPRQECDGATTEVRVREGSVSVRRAGRHWQLLAGDHWPRNCPATAAPKPPLSPPALARAPERAARRTRAPQAASTLAEQNDLFAAAMVARQRGDHQEARRRLDELLTRFPFGPLAESARSERARLSGMAPSAPP